MKTVKLLPRAVRTGLGDAGTASTGARWRAGLMVAGVI